MTVGVVRVRRLVGDAQAEIKQERGEDVGGRFDGIGYQRVGMAGDPGDALDQGEDDVAEDAEEDNFRGLRLWWRGGCGHGDGRVQTGAYCAAIAARRGMVLSFGTKADYF